jgi:hypothetical protein
VLLGTPREVLARLVTDDPLGMRARLAARLRERALLVDGERVLLRAFAHVASHASTWRGRPALADWLRARLDEATDDVLAEEEDLALDGRSPSLGPTSTWRLLARPLGLDPARMRAGCGAFNRLPLDAREAFHRVVLEGEELEHVARDLDQPLGVVARGARAGLLALVPEGTPANHQDEQP